MLESPLQLYDVWDVKCVYIIPYSLKMYLILIICLVNKRGFDSIGGNAGAAYRDLQKLSRVFKDQLAYPLIATARAGISSNQSQFSRYCCAPLHTSYSTFIHGYLHEMATYVCLPPSAALGLPALFGLAALPPELLLRIMRLLDVHSLLLLCGVCRHLHSATHDASLWKYLLHRDFRGINTSHAVL